MAQERVKLEIKGMTCEGCADTISRHLKREKGVERVSIDWKAGRATVDIDAGVTSKEDILQNRMFHGHYSAKLTD